MMKFKDRLILTTCLVLIYALRIRNIGSLYVYDYIYIYIYIYIKAAV